jgi:hypothetical protein
MRYQEMQCCVIGPAGSFSTNYNIHAAIESFPQVNIRILEANDYHPQ